MRAMTYTYNGETRTCREWAAYFGIDRSTFYGRLRSGMRFEEAIIKCRPRPVRIQVPFQENKLLGQYLSKPWSPINQEVYLP